MIRRSKPGETQADQRKAQAIGADRTRPKGGEAKRNGQRNLRQSAGISEK